MGSTDAAPIVTLYDEVHAALRDERLTMAVPDALQDADLDWMLNHDGATHRRLQLAFRRAFTPRAIARVRHVIEQLVEELVGDLRRDGTVDVVDRFAFRLPIHTIRQLFGAPELDPEEVHDWWHAIMLAYGTDVDEQTRDRITSAANDFASALDDVVRLRRRSPQDDVLSALVVDPDSGLSDRELIGNAMLVIGAGFETTMALVASSVVRLVADPDIGAVLRRDRRLIPGAIEEVLRMESPVISVTRTAATSVRIGGRDVAPGMRVVLDLAAANRDPRKFDRPLEFDVHRAPNPHLAFGGGPHHCLGAALARQEAVLAVDSLLLSLPRISLVADQVRWMQHPILHCPEQLVVTVGEGA